MSSELHRLIGRAFADQNLRNQLVVNPSTVLAGFNLTQDERGRILAGLGKAQADTTLAQIDQALRGKLLGW